MQMRQDVPLEVTLSLLAEHAQLHAVVAGWLRSEWPSWYGPDGSANADDDVRRCSQVDQLPLGLLAFVQGTPCGFGVLKQDLVPGYEDATPWLGAGFVVPSLRGHGIGLRVVHALEAQAQRMGYPHVYCATSTAQSLMERAGWSHAGDSSLGGKHVAIYRSAPWSIGQPETDRVP
jgi:GNAT superfamily N-acetyltransferase